VKPDAGSRVAVEIRSQLALFLHSWPQSFPYTLTKAVGLGLTPEVPDIGARAECVRASGLGIAHFPSRSTSGRRCGCSEA
jgi:hypothetical protein